MLKSVFLYKDFFANISIVLNKYSVDSHKLLWDFNIQTDRLTSARRPDLIIINKKQKKKKKKKKKKNENLQNYRLCCPGGPQNKFEGE